MSRDMFEGLDNILKERKEGKRERYEPGEAVTDPALVECLLDYLRKVIPQHHTSSASLDAWAWDWFDSMVQLGDYIDNNLLVLINPAGGYDAQAFIDDVLAGLARESDDKVIHWADENLFAPVFKTLHGAGYNDLVYNARYLPCQPNPLCQKLKGDEDNPLSIVVFTGENEEPSVTVGTNNDCAIIRLVGDAKEVGVDSSLSEYHIEGRVHQIGQSTFVSEFYMYGVEDAEIKEILLVDPIAVTITGYGYLEDMPEQEFYSVTFKCGDECKETLLDKLFFDRGNQLFIPDEDNPGEWKEVKP